MDQPQESSRSIGAIPGHYGQSLKSRVLLLFGAVLGTITVVYWALVLTAAFGLSRATQADFLRGQLDAAENVLRIALAPGKSKPGLSVLPVVELREAYIRLLKGPYQTLEITDPQGVRLVHTLPRFEGKSRDSELWSRFLFAGSDPLELQEDRSESDSRISRPLLLLPGWKAGDSIRRFYLSREVAGTPWRIIAGAPAPDLLQSLNTPAILSVGINLLFVCAIMAMIYVGLRRLVLGRLAKLQETMDRFGEMDFDARVEDAQIDEIGTLGRRFNRMAEIVQTYHRVMENQAREIIAERNSLRHKNEQIVKDLDLARTIQGQLIPKTGPLPELHFHYHPMELVGGDFFDFITFRNSPLVGMFISDVSGHGVPAAFITTMIKSTLLQAAPYIKSPAYLLRMANDNLFGKAADNFVTAFYGIYDPVRRELTYASAGHNPPFLVSADGVRVLALPGGGIPLAVMDSGEAHDAAKDWTNRKIQFSPGDRLILYTDGLTEAVHASADHDAPCAEFGDRALPGLLEACRGKNGADLLRSIVEGLSRFRGVPDYDDDVCLVVLEVK
jgi:serine phosphatase RsbU (regulator of sigma subunit)/HAMP domain-containing protein